MKNIQTGETTPPPTHDEYRELLEKNAKQEQSKSTKGRTAKADDDGGKKADDAKK